MLEPYHLATLSGKVSIGVACLLDQQYGCRRGLLAIPLTLEHPDAATIAKRRRLFGII
jgi:hypothetical protein